MQFLRKIPAMPLGEITLQLYFCPTTSAITCIMRRNCKVLLVCASRVWNSPRLYNVPWVLGAEGYQALVIGYQADDLPLHERIGRKAAIVRLRLRSRAISIPALRKIAATLEFLWAARKIVKRCKPDILITFNEPATLLHTWCSFVSLRIAWALEYPEFERHSIPERLLMRWSTRHWSDADWFVAPTLQRLALSMGLQPRLLEKRAFVVHNAPARGNSRPQRISNTVSTAVQFLEEQGGQGQLRIIYAGAIGNRYAIDRLVMAVGGEPRFSLLLVGKKHNLSRSEVGEALSVCDLDGRFLWLDSVPYTAMKSCLRTADIGFCTYLGDSLNTRFSAPGKLYEYLEAGLVLLTDSESCLRAELQAAGCGVFFAPPATADSIRHSLRDLSARADQLEIMKERSRRLFLEQMHMEQQMAPLLEAIKAR